MSRREEDDAGERDAEELDAAVADAFTERDEMIPTNVDEVRAAEDDGVEEDVELPASLRVWSGGASEEKRDEAAPGVGASAPRRIRDADGGSGAASERVVSLDELRRARAERRGLGGSHVASFAVGLAVAAGVAFFLRTKPLDGTHEEPGAGTGAPAASGSAAPVDARVEIGAVRGCGADCAAGSSCAAAQGELRACASGRTCVPGGEIGSAAGVYRVRIANLVPTKLLDGVDLGALDVCARALGGAWSCVPAFAEPSAAPPARTMSKLMSAADLANGLEVELRPRGTKQVLGRWRDAVRMGPTTLCRGVGALVSNEKDEHVGSLLLLLDDTHWVELGRSADVASLKAARAKLGFADVVPQIVETGDAGAGHFVLALGPFDQATAEKLRWALLEKGQPAKIELGEGYVGAPLALP